MITIQELSSYLDTYLSISDFSDFCPNGLQVEGKEKLQKVMTAVTASAETIEKAVEWGADALVVHHGLFWNSTSPVVVGPMKRKLELLLKHDISLLAYHLPLDAHQEIGNNWKAAEDLGWDMLEPFQEIGVKGTFEPIPVEAFQEQVERYFDHNAHVALGGKSDVSSAAFISGGAYRSLEKAAKAGIDCFITGNFDEPAWHIAKEQGINFFALGHHATETVGVESLSKHLSEKFALQSEFFNLNNPF